MYIPCFKKSVFPVVLCASIFFFSNAKSQFIRLTLTNPEDAFDETLIAFLDDATDSADAHYDLPEPRDSSAIILYSKIGAKAYSVQALPTLADDKTILLGIDASLSGMYRLRLSDVEGIDESIVVILEDTYSGTSVNLRKNIDYWFNIAAGSGIERLRLHFNPAIQIAAIDGQCDGTLSLLQMNQAGVYNWNYEIKNENDVVIDSRNAWNGLQKLTEIPTGDYTLFFTDQYGYSFSKSVHIEDKKAVIAQFQVSDSIVPVNQPVYFFDYSVGATDYAWDFGDGNVLSGTPFPLNVFDEPGIYQVRFTANNYECNDVSFKTVHVVDNTTGVNSIDVEAALIYSYGKEVFVDFKNQSGIAHLEIYNLLGQRIYHEELLAEGKQSVQLQNGCSFCLVKVFTHEKHFEAKIFLN